MTRTETLPGSCAVAEPRDLAGGKPAQAKSRSYGGVLKSSALIGGSSVIEIGFRIIRTKAMAVLVGPAGIGMLGLYTTINELVRNLAGLGLRTSGVRQIAEAAGTGEVERIARTATTLRRVALVSGLAGAALLFVASPLVSRVTFGDGRHTLAIALLALCIPLSDISDAQAALLQGMRRIADLARMTILGALLGTVCSIPIVYVWGERGLAPSLVVTAAMGILTSWWYARRIGIERPRMTLRDTLVESRQLLSFGLAFMASGFMWMGSAYLVRLVILRSEGVEAAGFFQAAWALGGLYTNLLFRSMAADFYPRLTAAAADNHECNRLANEQAEVMLLLACPGVLATLTMAATIIRMFYAASFEPAVPILRWICVGMLLQVTAWSLGYIVMAKGKQRIFFWSELLSNVTLLAAVWAGVALFGLTGSGMGFAAMYSLYSVGTYFVVRHLTGFRLSVANWRLAGIFAPTIAAVFAAPYVLSPTASLLLGLGATAAVSVYSVRRLCGLISIERMPEPVQRLLRVCRFVPIPAAPAPGV